MREIRFRIIWKGKEFYWGYCEGGFEGIPTCSGGLSLEKAKELSRQFTGLHDKNGKEIYEGDIVSVKGHTSEDIFVSLVSEKRGGFWLDKDYLGNWKEYMLEVIGSIYSNPELLNQKV